MVKRGRRRWYGGVVVVGNEEGDGGENDGGIWGENGGEMMEKWVAMGGRRGLFAAAIALCKQKEEERKRNGWKREKEWGIYKGKGKHYNNVALTNQKDTQGLAFPSPKRSPKGSLRLG